VGISVDMDFRSKFRFERPDNALVFAHAALEDNGALYAVSLAILTPGK
jgi:hypothetical protein